MSVRNLARFHTSSYCGICVAWAIFYTFPLSHLGCLQSIILAFLAVLDYFWHFLYKIGLPLQYLTQPYCGLSLSNFFLRYQPLIDNLTSSDLIMWFIHDRPACCDFCSCQFYKTSSNILASILCLPIGDTHRFSAKFFPKGSALVRRCFLLCHSLCVLV